MASSEGRPTTCAEPLLLVSSVITIKKKLLLLLPDSNRSCITDLRFGNTRRVVTTDPLDYSLRAAGGDITYP
jgi:hypothetical protein